MTDFAANLAMVEARIAAACESARRNRADVRLVAVSKGHEVAAIRAFYELGLRDFGESYVGEWQAKRPELPDDIRWHFIGALQSRKARELADAVHLIHSVDRMSLARQIDKRWTEPADVLLQVNIDDDDAKSGCERAETASLLRQILAECPDVHVRGLMTIPSLAFSEAPEGRPNPFADLRTLRDELLAEFDHENAPLTELSMGMTNDLEIAVRSGATLVRVGTALFGPRNP